MYTIKSNGSAKNAIEIEITTSAEQGIDDKFCQADNPDYDGYNLDNFWFRVITPVDQLNVHNRLWVSNNVNEQGLIGPFATLGEAFDVASDPLLGCVAGEGLFRPVDVA